MKITRAFSRKIQLKQYEPIEAFCSVEMEIDKKDFKKKSEELSDICMAEVEKTLEAYQVSKVAKFDEGDSQIKPKPWDYKKDFGKIYFAGNKDIKENAKTDSELDTEKELEN